MFAWSGRRASLVGAVLLAIASAGCAGSALDTGPSQGGGGAGGRGPADAGSQDAVGGTGGSSAAGSGGSAAGSGGSQGSGGRSGAGGGGGSPAGSGGAGGAMVGCGLRLALIPPQTEGNLTSGANSSVRLRASLSHPAPKAPTFRWVVQFLNVSPFKTLDTEVVDDIPMLTSRVGFLATLPGLYAVTVFVDGLGTPCQRTMDLTVNRSNPASYVFRVSPPASLNLEVPTQDIPVNLQEGARPRVPILLSRGVRRSLTLQAADDSYVPAYLRVSSVPGGVRMEGHTGRGPFDVLMLPSVTYEVLVIPDGKLAPVLLSGSSELFTPEYSRMRIDQGTPVTGSMLDGDGAPVVGARIVLRDGLRPSTMGTTDSAGNFVLWARPGRSSALVVPPPTAGLPEATVTELPGIPVDPAGTTLSMKWTTFQRGTVSVAVKSTNGLLPVAGALVRVEAKYNPEREAGILRVAGNQPVALAATGGVRIDATTDAGGVASFPSLPVDAYTITVVPPPSLTGAGVTMKDVTLTAAGATETIVLARPLMLRGTLLPRDGSTGVRVVARDQGTGLVAPTVSAVTGPSGEYVLPLAPGRQYRLSAEPARGSLSFARTILGTRSLASADGTAPNYTVAAGVSFEGVVLVLPGGETPVAGAVVQVFCVGSPPACEDPEFALAEAVTGPTGTFGVTLPAPVLPIR